MANIIVDHQIRNSFYLAQEAPQGNKKGIIYTYVRTHIYICIYTYVYVYVRILLVYDLPGISTARLNQEAWNVHIRMLLKLSVITSAPVYQKRVLLVVPRVKQVSKSEASQAEEATA